MKKEILFEAIGEIDDELIEESESIPAKRKKGRIIPFVSAAAACLVLLCAGGIHLAQLGMTDSASAETAAPEDVEATMEEAVAEEEAPETGEDKANITGGYEDGNGVYAPKNNYNIVYNHYDEVELLAADRLPGFFEELSEEELQHILPASADRKDISGKAEFSYLDGALCYVDLQVGTTLAEDVRVSLSSYEHFGDCCVVVYPDADTSIINGVEYEVFSHYWNDDELYLWATTEINDTYLRFEFTVHPDDEEQAKKDFEAILECFSTYDQNHPDLSVITPDVVPEYINEELSHNEATENEVFGAYVPKNGPYGFGETYFHYSKWGNVHNLTAHWYRGLDSFEIYISDFGSADKNRLVEVSETEKYDLNLYPIPRAESVPDELREVVNDPIFEIDDLTLEAVKLRTYYIEDAGDTDGPRMDFSVKYGDVLVRVIAKGVEPEWVYECLKNLG